jgi:nucleotide-binding universal stress UspA family protein
MTGAKRRTTPARAYRRILWPTDFSRLANAALPHALKIAAQDGAELIVMHVVAPPVLSPAPVMSGAVWGRLEKEMRHAALDRLRRVISAAHAKERTVRTRTLVVLGSPFVQIPRAAQRLRCDLIVLATHGHTGLRHVLLGSVAENVVRNAPCPVLTVRPARRGK